VSAANADDLDVVIAGYLEAAERGAPPDPAEWLGRHPAHAAELAAFLADLTRFGAFLNIPPPGAADATADYRHREGDGEPAPCERFGDYQLLGEIGRGAMGVVYRARLVGTSRVVALKRLRPGGGGGADAARRFREEVEAVSGLEHPNIVPVHHVGEDGGGPFYTMALVEGGSLDAHMARFRGDPRAAVRLVAKVARAVHHAHQRRILHRDLKPSNILLDKDGEPRVADFGLATRLSEVGSADAGPPAGSLPWMAPEAVRGDAVLTTAVDVWGLGVVLYELLTGGRPFRAGGRAELAAAILAAAPPPPRDVNPAVDRDLDAVCRRCLAAEPDRRYESASAVALELERWLRDEPVRARQPGRAERFARWCRRNPGLTAAAILLVALVAVGAAAAATLARGRDEATRRNVCRDNEYTAELAAGAFLRRIDAHKRFVRDAAGDGALRKACAAGDAEAARAVLRDWFERQPAPGAVPIATLYLLDPAGTLRAVWGVPTERPSVEGEPFDYRDYFRGAMARARRPGADGVHVSQVFRARSDGLDKLAVSVAFPPSGGGRPWVLAATIPTDPTLGLGVRDDARHGVVLLAPRETLTPPEPGREPERVILVHPAYEPRDESIPFPAGLLRPRPAPDGRDGFEPDDDYRDPVRDRHPGYDGRWLAGFAPVEGTDMVVVVQQRDDDALAPERAFFRRFLAWAAGLVGGAGLAAFAALRLARSRRSRAENLPAG
jgi:serine/threonine-protein kinase